MNRFLIYIIIFFVPTFSYCQNNDFEKELEMALRPSKATFYSAVLPGLGQAYNKKYWKIPVVYGALATGIYFYNQNDQDYNRYRNAYKRRLAGFTDDEFYGNGQYPAISNDGLIRAQKTLKRNKELSILVTVGLYILNIIDANVDAHLLQYNLDENLTLIPNIEFNEVQNTSNFGISLNIEL
tara:strand:+ start:220 stop:765 length:546 start_codon:yes stop_codon:yes gene_type:complete